MNEQQNHPQQSLEGHEDHIAHDTHHHEHTNIAIMVTVGVVLLIIVGAGAFFLGQNYKEKQTVMQPTPAVATYPTTSPTAPPNDETANWKTYTNTNNKYSLKYPIYWTVDESSPNTVEITSSDYVRNNGADSNQKPKGVAIRVITSTTSSTDPDEVYNSYKKDPATGDKMSAAKNITVAGLPAVQYSINNMFFYTSTLLIQGGKLYEIQLDTIDSTENSTYLSTYTTILDSLKLKN